MKAHKEPDHITGGSIPEMDCRSDNTMNLMFLMLSFSHKGKIPARGEIKKIFTHVSYLRYTNYGILRFRTILL